MNVSGQTATMLSSGAVRADDEVAVGEISALAIVSLVFGLASPLSLAAPLLWAIPLVGAAIAIMTIRRIAASDGARVGRLAALVGLALCVGSLAAAATRSIVTELTLSYEARDVATQWLAILKSGDTRAAFDSTAAAARGPAPAPPPGPPAASEPVRDPLADFRDHPLVRYMATVGNETDVRFAGQQGSGAELIGGGRVTEDFLVTPGKGSTSPAVTVHISVQRMRPNSLSAAKWLIADYAGDNLPAASGDSQ